MNGRRGFTLIELISTIVILAVVGSVASTVLLSATDRYLDAATAAQLDAEGSVALDRIVRELRRVDLDDTATGIAPDIDSVTASSIAWGGDSSVALNGTALKLIIGGASARVLQTDVSGFEVAVYDESNAVIALPLAADACDPIRRVEVALTLARHGVSVPLRTRVYLRATLAGGAP